MIAVCVTFIVNPEATARFQELVAAQARASLANEAACRRFDVWSTAEAPHQVFLYELYDDRGAFDAHLNTPHFQQFDADCATLVREKSVKIFDDALELGE